MLLQMFESIGQFRERRTVAQRSRLTLDHRQIMTPIIDRLPWRLMGTVDDAAMFADDLAFRHDHEPVGIDAQADRPVGEGCVGIVAEGRVSPKHGTL
jgi:hypothetical protein